MNNKMETKSSAQCLPKLRISANRRYFITDDGRPFRWLADTVWTMPQRIKWDDVEYYMQTRKRQGFTVLQIVALDPEQDEEVRNPAGEKALLNDDVTTPNEKYFSYLDWILDRAEYYGFYVLLLPVWGQMVVGENWSGQRFPKTVNESNAYTYGRWIGERYRNRSNILWCLGGDRQPIHNGTDFRNVWRRLAEGLAKGVLGKDLKYNQDSEEWTDLLITYHACYEAGTGECSTMSYWTDEEAWIRFIMLQSGHGLISKNYELVQREYNRKNIMPVWDGEPAYEAMPTSWPVIESRHGSWMVRKRAYWSLFAGAFGFTYGHASMWCSISPQEVNELNVCSWYDALQYEGAGHMKILRDFMESVDLSGFKPCQEILLTQKENPEHNLDDHIQACIDSDKKMICVYFPHYVRETLDLPGFPDSVLLNWYNPRTGENFVETTDAAIQDRKLMVSPPTDGPEDDWILILGTDGKDISVNSRTYGEDIQKEAVKKVFEW